MVDTDGNSLAPSSAKQPQPESEASTPGRTTPSGRDPELWAEAKARTRRVVEAWVEAGSPFTRYAVGRMLRQQYRRLASTGTATTATPPVTNPLRAVGWSREVFDAMVRQNQMAAGPELMQKLQEERDHLDQSDGPACGLCEGARFVRVTADRDDPRFGRVAPCECVRNDPVEFLLQKAAIPPPYLRSMHFETFLPLENALAFKAMQTWDGVESMLLCGPPGRGKTHLAVAALRSRIEAGVRGQYAYVPDLLDDIRRRFNPDHAEDAQTFVDRIASVPLLLLDDLGAEYHKRTRGDVDWASERITAIVDRRLRNGLTTLVTTNIDSDGAMDDVLGSRAASRLGSYRRVQCGGVDMRLRQEEER